jgi:hypothetical protein
VHGSLQLCGGPADLAWRTFDVPLYADGRVDPQVTFPVI